MFGEILIKKSAKTVIQYSWPLLICNSLDNFDNYDNYGDFEDYDNYDDFEDYNDYNDDKPHQSSNTPDHH